MRLGKQLPYWGSELLTRVSVSPVSVGISFSTRYGVFLDRFKSAQIARSQLFLRSEAFSKVADGLGDNMSRWLLAQTASHLRVLTSASSDDEHVDRLPHVEEKCQKYKQSLVLNPEAAQFGSWISQAC